MQIFDSADGMTGGWFRLVRDQEMAIATTSASNFAGATASIQIGDQLKAILNENTDRDFTAGFDEILSLKSGMHIRIAVTNDATATDIQVAAFPADALIPA